MREPLTPAEEVAADKDEALGVDRMVLPEDSDDVLVPDAVAAWLVGPGVDIGGHHIVWLPGVDTCAAEEAVLDTDVDAQEVDWPRTVDPAGADKTVETGGETVDPLDLEEPGPLEAVGPDGPVDVFTLVANDTEAFVPENHEGLSVAEGNPLGADILIDAVEVRMPDEVVTVPVEEPADEDAVDTGDLVPVEDAELRVAKGPDAPVDVEVRPVNGDEVGWPGRVRLVAVGILVILVDSLGVAVLDPPGTDALDELANVETELTD